MMWSVCVAMLVGGLAIGSSLPGQEQKEKLGLELIEGLRLKIEIERDFDGAQEGLEQVEKQIQRSLKVHSSGQERLDLEGMLATTLVLMARIQEARGDFSAAMELLERVRLVRLGGVARRDYEDLKRRLEAVRGDRDEQARVGELTLQLLERGDLDAVGELGALAVPTLVDWIERHLDEFPGSVEQDPLTLLGSLSPAAAAAVVGRHVEDASYLFKKRVLRVMHAHRIFQEGSDFETGDESAPRRARLPEWMQAVEVAVQEPALAGEVFPLVRRVLVWDACTPRLQALLLRALEPTDPRFQHAVRALDPNGTLGRDVRFGESARGVLEHALASSDPNLRLVAANIWIRSLPDRGPLHGRADDPDPRVRAEVAGALAAARDLHAADRQVLEQLAADEDEQVLNHVGHHLGRVPWDEGGAEDLPILSALYGNPRLSELPDLRKHFVRVVKWAVQDDACLAEITGHALRTDDGPVLVSIAEQREKNVLFRLPVELLEPFTRKLYETSPGDLSRLIAAVTHPKPPDAPSKPALVEKLRGVALRPGLDSGLTLLLGLCDPWSTGPKLLPVLRSAIADRRWTAESLATRDRWLLQFLSDGLKYLPGGMVNELLLPLLRDSTLPDDLLQNLVDRSEAAQPAGVEVLRATLDRWLDAEPDPGSEQAQAVERALARLGRFPFEGSDEILRRVAREGRYLESVASAMGERRDPAFVPDLAAIVRDPRTRKSQFDAAFHALRGFLSDETAEVLLDLAAEVGAGEVRDQCLATVEDIRAYQAARERWERRKLERETAERALAQLLELLDSGSETQRVEAARALATLGAVESLPRLIRLLEDPSPALREAAREALGRLNRPDPLEEGTAGD